MYKYFNENPLGSNVDDCTIRALATAMDKSWDEAYLELAIEGYIVKDLPNANRVWCAVLHHNGFDKRNLPCDSLGCYTVKQFAEDHKEGTYVLGDGRHAIACRDGDYYDTFDSGDRTVLFYFEKGNDK